MNNYEKLIPYNNSVIGLVRNFDYTYYYDVYLNDKFVTKANINANDDEIIKLVEMFCFMY